MPVPLSYLQFSEELISSSFCFDGEDLAFPRFSLRVFRLSLSMIDADGMSDCQPLSPQDLAFLKHRHLKHYLSVWFLSHRVGVSDAAYCKCNPARLSTLPFKPEVL
eukprot:2949859-Amphidinium_carterae.1